MQATIQAKGKYLAEGDYLLESHVYQTNKSTALQITQNGEPKITLSVCIPEYALEENEVLIKSWSENEGVAEHLIESGVLVDTGKRVPSGFCEAMVCTLGIELTWD